MSIATLEKYKKGFHESKRFTPWMVNFAEGFIDLFLVADGEYSYLLSSRFTLHELSGHISDQPALLAAVTAIWQSNPNLVRVVLRVCDLLQNGHRLDVLEEIDPSKVKYDQMSDVTYYEGYDIVKQGDEWLAVYRSRVHPSDTYSTWQSFGERTPVKFPYDPLDEAEKTYYTTPYIPLPSGGEELEYTAIPKGTDVDLWLAEQATKYYYGVKYTEYGSTVCFLTAEQVTAIAELWVGKLSTDALVKSLEAKDPMLAHQILQLYGMIYIPSIHLPPLYVGHVHSHLPGIMSPAPKYDSFVLAVDPDKVPAFLDKMGTRYEAFFARDEKGNYQPAKVKHFKMTEVDIGSLKLKTFPSKL
ncbi:hypothetical protein CPT_Moabite_286 [Serratia phage Moabite]|uniref:Uncharacterized protein n=2 Tax=Moabitevirus moabite TaxID=2846181 RepID=A0A7T3NBW1_9CAUD|nr:hypothetical protein HWC48_gp130 [Serratia phage Moabite]QDB71316.1 hypothetical protein CPT_Moabite_286 [Serratia phage Moabite]QPX76868.1 hypothetical protein [Serratia phage vB_SmaM_Yaphecito]UGO54169.1 hypothetical protein HAYMO_187 [Serratia phage vB_SmaM_Haymo]